MLKPTNPGLWLFICLCACGRPAGQSIISRPIPFGAQREQLTLDYIRQHYDSGATDIQTTPQIIVIHWTVTPTLESLYAVFGPDTLAASRNAIRRGGRVNVSSQFAVDRDGTIYQLMPGNRMARHTIGLNRISIGIENIGGPEQPLTSSQLQANAWLVRRLCKEYPGIRFLIGHHEYLAFRATPFWQEKDPTYVTSKQDPGADFMLRLRQSVSELMLLAGPP